MNHHLPTIDAKCKWLSCKIGKGKKGMGWIAYSLKLLISYYFHFMVYSMKWQLYCYCLYVVIPVLQLSSLWWKMRTSGMISLIMMNNLISFLFNQEGTRTQAHHNSDIFTTPAISIVFQHICGHIFCGKYAEKRAKKQEPKFTWVPLTVSEFHGSIHTYPHGPCKTEATRYNTVTALASHGQ